MGFEATFERLSSWVRVKIDDDDRCISGRDDDAPWAENLAMASVVCFDQIWFVYKECEGLWNVAIFKRSSGLTLYRSSSHPFG